MKKLEIRNVVFQNYNGQDNLYMDVLGLKGILKSKPVYENSKILGKGTKDEGKLWVKIWDCGIARFGFTMKADPMHGNEPYTWSSNSTEVNKQFNLIGTKYEIARYGCGAREVGDSGCYLAIDLLRSLALEIGEENQDKLHWGIELYKQTIDTSAPYVDGRD